MKTFRLIFIFIVALCWFYSCKNNATVKEYYDTGELKAEYGVKDGIRDGLKKEYFKNGKLMNECSFINNKKEGKAFIYYQNGKVYQDLDFRNNLQDGKLIEFYPDGRLQEVSIYSKGKSNGETHTYYHNQHLKYYDITDMDSILYAAAYDSLGNLFREKWTIRITPEKNVIKLGESYNAKIKIYGPIHKYYSLEMEVADRVLNRGLNCETFKLNEEKEYNFSFMPKKTGVFYLNVDFGSFKNKTLNMKKVISSNNSRFEVLP